jgi:ribosome maturation protein SDO1
MRIQPEQRKINQTVAKLKREGKNYEIIIDCETALQVREGKASPEEALLVHKIFKDARKGDVQGDLEEAFGTNDILKIAEEIIMKGEIPLTQEYRDKIVDQKRNQILEELTRKAVDPTSNYPIPRQRIELGIEKIGYKISFEKGIKEQVEELKTLLKEAMPISFKEIMVTITSPPKFAAQTFSIVKSAGEVSEQNYQPDGSLVIKARVLPGKQKELRDKINIISHGLIKIKEE